MTKRALFIAGGWDGHQPKETSTLFGQLLQDSGYHAQISETLDVLLDDAYMATVDLLVPVWTMGEISRPQLDGLLRAAERGTGIGGWHGGMGDAFRASTEYQFLTGGQWVAHPGDIIDYTVEIADTGDPITAGLGAFRMRSEQYYMHVDPSNHVLATTTFSGDIYPWIAGTTIPVAWTRQYGPARIFYCSLGHKLSDFDVPEAREIVRRGLHWATR